MIRHDCEIGICHLLGRRTATMSRLPAILIPVEENVAQLAAKPSSEKVERNSMAWRSNDQ